MAAFAGIGSRQIIDPTTIYEFQWIVGMCCGSGLTLRSGGAQGCDMYAEQACDDAFGNKEIFLPWPGFNNNKSLLVSLEYDAQAEEIAKRYHPTWDRLSSSARKLMLRNVYQVLGKTLDHPVDFVVCWTPDGCEAGNMTTRSTGGTGQAIRIADDLLIPIFNLAKRGSVWRLLQFLKDNYNIEV